VACDLCIGDLCFRNETVSAVTTEFSSVAPGKTNGMIGMTTLKDFVVSLYRDRTVGLTLHGTACIGKVVPTYPDPAGIHRLDVRVGDHIYAQVPLDTGATRVLLSGSSAEQLRGELSNVEPAPICNVKGCSEKGFRAELSEYCIGETCSTDVPVKYPVWDTAGLAMLSRFRVDLDLPHNRVVFCSSNADSRTPP